MSRINTNVNSLVAQQRLGRSNESLQTSLTRLSTGLRINTASDDPAGLIASNNLRRDITVVSKAISNSEQAGRLIATADSALGEVSSLLDDIRGLISESANSGVLSDDQIAANQLQVDSSLEAIDRIAQSTTFQGKQLLDGSLGFIVGGLTNGSTVSELVVDQATIGSSGSVSVDVDITSAAAQASITVGTSAFALGDDLVVQISGASGAEVFAFDSGSTITQAVNAINLVTDATGITASNASGVLTLTSSAYGSDAFVDVEVISEGSSGNFESGLSATRDAGSDIVATVNGVQASGDGNKLTVNTSTLDLSATVTDGSSTDFSFNVTGGGAVFQLGPEVVANQQARLGIDALNTATLGGVSGRLYQLRSGQNADLDTNTTTGAKIVDEAISKVGDVRGRLGAFQRTTLQSNITALQDTLVNLTESESAIRDADFAAESAELTRNQVLVQSGTSVLAIANQNPQNVLALLG